MPRVRIHYLLTSFVISAFVLSFLAFGQNISSSVKALIVDPSGAPVAGADCVLIDQATGAMFRAVSDPGGSRLASISTRNSSVNAVGVFSQ